MLSKPVVYKAGAVFERLNQPKQEYQAKQPNIESDFRGLLNADYQEAVQNCSDEPQAEIVSQFYKRKPSTAVK